MRLYPLIGCLLLLAACMTVPGRCAAAPSEDAGEEAVRCARQGDLGRALRLMREYLSATNDAGPRTLYDYAVILSWAGEYGESIRVYESAASRTPAPAYAMREAALSYRRTGRYGNAAALYREYLATNGFDQEAARGLVYTYIDAGQPEKAAACLKALAAEHKGVLSPAAREEIAGALLAKFPASRDALLLKGELQMARGDHAAAWQTYAGTLRLYPDCVEAKKGRTAALLGLGAWSLVQEQQARDAAVEKEMRLRQAMACIAVEEPAAAVALLDAADGLVGAQDEAFAVKLGSLKIVALHAAKNMQRVVKEYAKLEALHAPLPAIVMAKAANACYVLRQPRKALSLARAVLREKPGPDGGEAQEIAASVLINLNRFDEAEAALRRLDAALPEQVFDRGVYRDNWYKDDEVRTRGWVLISRDRLSEAEAYFQTLLSSAPANAHTRSALAHIELWRGHPRAALEEFRLCRTLAPGTVTNETGYAYALNENGYRAEARALAKELSTRYPKDPTIDKLQNDLRVEDLRGISLTVNSLQENPGSREIDWLLRYEQPVRPGQRLYAEGLYRENSEGGLSSIVRRGWVGYEGNMTRVTKVAASFSVNTDGTKAGAAVDVRQTMGDDFAVRAAYDSYSLDVPLRARAFGIDAQEAGANVYYHRDERLEAEAAAWYQRMSDDNEHWTWTLKADQALTTDYDWKTRLGLEAATSTNLKTDVPYFSPEYIGAAYLVPKVEHLWFRSYERSLVDRLAVGVGGQWQKSFSGKEVWFGRYEQEYKLSAAAGVDWSGMYAKRDYDNVDTYTWEFNVSLRYRF